MSSLIRILIDLKEVGRVIPLEEKNSFIDERVSYKLNAQEDLIIYITGRIIDEDF